MLQWATPIYIEALFKKIGCPKIMCILGGPVHGIYTAPSISETFHEGFKRCQGFRQKPWSYVPETFRKPYNDRIFETLIVSKK